MLQLPHNYITTTTNQRPAPRRVFDSLGNSSPGVLFEWVCRDRLEYLDVTGDCFKLTPSGGRKPSD